MYVYIYIYIPNHLSKGTVARAAHHQKPIGTSRSANEGRLGSRRLTATHWMWQTCCGPLPAWRSPHSFRGKSHGDFP